MATSEPFKGAEPLHAAFHEAGHFVAHHYLVPSEVPVRFGIFDDGGGYYAWGAPPSGEPDDPGKMRGRVVAIYAGAAADLRLDPSREEAIRADAKHDDEQATKCLDRLGELDREVMYRGQARAFVADHWREIQAVAATLLELETLRGDVAEMVLDLVNGVDVESAVQRITLSRAPEVAMKIAQSVALRLAGERSRTEEEGLASRPTPVFTDRPEWD